MNSQSLISVVGFVTAGTVLVVGVAVLIGMLLPASVPDTSRLIVGCLMIVYGLYRTIMMWTRHRSKKEQTPDEAHAQN